MLHPSSSGCFAFRVHVHAFVLALGAARRVSPSGWFSQREDVMILKRFQGAGEVSYLPC